MAIRIPGIQQTQISSNVRRLDAGLQTNTRERQAKAQLGGQVAGIAFDLAKTRNDAANKADETKSMGDATVGMKAEITALGIPNAKGKVNIGGEVPEFVQYSQAVKGITEKWAANSQELDVSDTVKGNLNNKITSLGTRLQTSAMGTENVQIAKGIGAAGLETASKMASAQQVMPDLGSMEESLGNLKDHYDAVETQTALGENNATTQFKAGSEAIIAGHVEGLIDTGNSKGAEDFMANSKLTGMLSEKGLKKLNNRVSAATRKQDATSIQKSQLKTWELQSAVKSGKYTPAMGAQALNEAETNITDQFELDKIKRKLGAVAYTDKFNKLYMDATFSPNYTKHIVNQTLEEFKIDNPSLKSITKDEMNAFVSTQTAKNNLALSKDGATFAATNDRTLANQVAVMGANPKAFSNGEAALDAMYDAKDVPNVLRTYYTKADIEAKHRIISSAQEANSPGAALDVIEEMQRNAPHKMTSAFNQMVSGASGVKFAQDYAAMGFIESRSGKKDLLAAMYNPDLDKNYKDKVKDHKAVFESTVRKIYNSPELAFIGAVGGGKNSQAERNKSSIANTLGKIYKSGMGGNLSDADSYNKAIETIKSSFSYPDNNTDFFAIKNGSPVNATEVLTFKQTLLSPNNVKLDEIVSQLEIGTSTPEEYKEMLRDKAYFTNTADNQGIEIFIRQSGDIPQAVKFKGGKKKVSFSHGAIKDWLSSNTVAAEQERESILNKKRRMVTDIVRGTARSTATKGGGL